MLIKNFFQLLLFFLVLINQACIHTKTGQNKKTLDIVIKEGTENINETNKPEEMDRELFYQLAYLEKKVMDAEEQEAYKKAVTELDDFIQKVPIDFIAEIINQKRKRTSLASAYKRFSFYLFHLGKFNTAKKAITIALKLPHLTQEEQLYKLLSDIVQIEKVDQKALGIILPLSGPLAHFGKKALKAISMAVNIPLEPKEQHITVVEGELKIIIGDSGNNNAVNNILDEMIKTHHVAMIIGDIANESSLTVAQKCSHFKTPLLTLSRHPQLENFSNNVFMFNIPNKKHIEHLVDYAVNEKKHTRFAILYPRHNYGMTQAQIFFDTVKEKGGVITALEAYDPHTKSFFYPVRRLVGMGHIEQRDEYVACKKQLEDNDNSKNISIKCKRSVKPLIDFDALFIPEFDSLGVIIPTLVQEDILISSDQEKIEAYSLSTKNENPHYVQLLGTESWNNENTLRKIINQIDGAYFVDSVDFMKNEQLRAFNNRFKKAHGFSASLIDVLAYSAAWMAKNILTTNKDMSKEQINLTIANYNTNAGLLGNISFNEKNELNSKTFGFEVKNKDISVNIYSH